MAWSSARSTLRALADRRNRAHRLAVVRVRRDQHDAQDFWLALLDAIRHASGVTSDAEPERVRLRRAPGCADSVLEYLV
jgi:LuxR family maltose regulon positive regulatory protein